LHHDSMPRPPPRSTLFPYTTLFRSPLDVKRGVLLGEPREAARDLLFVAARLRGDGDAVGRSRQVQRRKRTAVLDADGVARERVRSEEHTSELQSRENLVCRLLLEKK